MEAEAERKRKPDQANSLDNPEAQDDIEAFGDIDPAAKQAILDDIAKKAAASGSSSSSSTDGGPKEPRAASVASATLAMKAASKRAEDAAKLTKKTDTVGKAGIAVDPDGQPLPPGVAETGTLAQSG